MSFREKSETANYFVLYYLKLVSTLTEFQLNRSAITYIPGELGVSFHFQCCTSLRFCWWTDKAKATWLEM